MNSMEAQAQLAEAQRLSATSRVASRWYPRYLVFFGIASFALAASFAVVDPFIIGAVLTPIWVVVVIGPLIAIVMRRRTAIRGYGAIHGAVMAGWTAGLPLTSPTLLGEAWWWPVLGGVIMAAAPFTGAYVALRRSRP